MLKIGEAAKYLGISRDTLRRWEASGKISSFRTSSGYRAYNLSSLEKIKLGAKEKITSQPGSAALKIGDAARHLGVSRDTLRRWERQGKIKFSRTPSGYRTVDFGKLQILASRGEHLQKKKRRFRIFKSISRSLSFPKECLNYLKVIEQRMYPQKVSFASLTKTGFLVLGFLFTISSSLVLSTKFIYKPLASPMPKQAAADLKRLLRDHDNKGINLGENPRVLGLSKSLKGKFTVNIPAVFNDSVTIKGLELDVGTLTAKEIVAPNIVNSINNLSRDVTFEAGSNIAITTDTSSNQIKIAASIPATNAFSSIKLGSDTVSAGSGDTFKFAAGSGISLSLDTSDKKLTIASSVSNDSGWTDGGTTVSLTTSSDTVNIGSLTASKVVFTDSSKNLTSSGTVEVTQGGTGLSSLSTGDMIYASAANTFSALSATSNGGKYLTVNSSSGLPEWVTLQVSGGGGGGGVSCTNCIVNNPTTAQTITPNATDVTGLIVAQTTAASPTVDIFSVTNSSGASGTKYLKVDNSGNMTVNGATTIGANTTGTALTITPGAVAGTPSTTGSGLALSSYTYTDNATSGTSSGVVTDVAFHSIAAPTLTSAAAARAAHAATLYIAGAPTASGSETITNAYALNIASGSTAFGGSINLTNSAPTINTFLEGNNTNSTGWNLGSNYFTYRRLVTVENNTTPGNDTLPNGFQVSITLTGAQITDICNNTRADNYDIRVAYNSGSIAEIARKVTRNCSGSTLTISFLAQAAITAGNSDANYYVYYGNPAISTCPSASCTYNYDTVYLDDLDLNANSWSSSDSNVYVLSSDTTTSSTPTTSVKGAASARNAAQGDVLSSWATSGGGTCVPGSTGVSGANVSTYSTSHPDQIYVVQGLYHYLIDINTSTGAYSNCSYEGAITAYGNQLDVMDLENATIGVTTYLYIFGGNGSGGGSSGTTAVQKTTVNSGGNPGDFTANNQTQLPAETRKGDVVVYTFPEDSTTYAYLIGGEAGGNKRDSAYRAQINSSGNIGTWSLESQTPGFTSTSNYTGETAAAIVRLSSGTYIYAIVNGCTDPAQCVDTPVYDLYYANIDTDSKDIGSWTRVAGGGVDAWQLQSSVINGTGYLYVVGGGQAVSTNVYKAVLASDGTISSGFTTTSQAQLSAVRRAAGSVIAPIGDKRYAYLVNGLISSSNGTNTLLLASLSTDYSATKTFSTAQDLTSMNSVTVDMKHNLPSSISNIYLELSTDGSTFAYASTAKTVPNGSSFTNVSWDISSIRGSLSAVQAMRIRMAVPVASALNLNWDNILAIPAIYGGSSSVTSGNKSLGDGALALNAQGTSAVRVNYDAANTAAGSGGINIYNGGSTSIFSVAGSSGINLNNSSGSSIFAVNTSGNITASFATANSERLCWDGSGASAITDCSGTPGDYAEEYGTNDKSIEAGDVVAIDTSKHARQIEKDGEKGSQAWIVKSTKTYQKDLLGIVSTQPNEVIGSNFSEEENPRPVALSGRVPVKVSLENGEIKPGDYLTSSSVPGVAMKATRPGQVIGKALEGFDNSQIGKILVFVSPTFADPSNILANLSIIPQATSSALLSLDTSFVFSEATLSARLTAYEGLFQNSLRSLGDTLLGNTTIAGNLTVDGTLNIENGNSISAAHALFIQSSPLSNLVDIFNGKVTITKEGEVSVQKLVVSNKSAGTAVIQAGHRSINVSTQAITSRSKVLVTPSSPVQFAVAKKDVASQSFTIEISSVYSEDLKFDWWLVDNFD